MRTLPALLLGITMTALPALAQPGPVTYGSVLPANTVIGGKTIGALAVDMWNWVYSIGTNENPQLDCGSGQWANNRQPNPLVFFIAPVNGSMPPCFRSFTIPENKHLLLPVMAITIENIHTLPPMTIPDMRLQIDAVIGNNIELRASVDGLEIGNLSAHRYTAPEFSYIFPHNDNTLSFFYHKAISGLVDPIIADGYWVLLEPLSPGPHSLYTRGTNAYHFPHEVICNVQVEPVPLEQWADALKAWVTSADLRSAKKRALVGKINSVRALVRRQKVRAAVGKLRSFQTIIERRVRHSDPALAVSLTDYAGRMILRAEKEF